MKNEVSVSANCNAISLIGQKFLIFSRVHTTLSMERNDMRREREVSDVFECEGDNN